MAAPNVPCHTARGELSQRVVVQLREERNLVKQRNERPLGGIRGWHTEQYARGTPMQDSDGRVTTVTHHVIESGEHEKKATGLTRRSRLPSMTKLDTSLTIDEIVARFPETIPVFNRFIAAVIGPRPGVR